MKNETLKAKVYSKEQFHGRKRMCFYGKEDYQFVRKTKGVDLNTDCCGHIINMHGKYICVNLFTKKMSYKIWMFNLKQYLKIVLDLKKTKQTTKQTRGNCSVFYEQMVCSFSKVKCQFAMTANITLQCHDPLTEIHQVGMVEEGTKMKLSFSLARDA